MPAKVKVTKDMIIDAAFAIAREACSTCRYCRRNDTL